MIFLSKFASEHAATCPSPSRISGSPSLNEMPTLQSATLLALSWLRHRCSHSNDSIKNKKRCSSCWAWRDGLAPLSAKGGTLTSRAAASNVRLINAASDIGLVNDSASCHDENGPPNNASPRRGGSPTKSRGGTKRKSPSRGLGGVLCPSLAPPSPPALCPMRRITSSPPPECSGISNGFFGEALTFAARSMQHTVNQLQRWAKEPNLGVKSFASSILSTLRSIYLLGDAQQMVGGSTNKLTAAGFDQADKKASTFNAAKFYLVGNNSTGANMFGRNKKI
jgi:hypothetical protein